MTRKKEEDLSIQELMELDLKDEQQEATPTNTTEEQTPVEESVASEEAEIESTEEAEVVEPKENISEVVEQQPVAPIEEKKFAGKFKSADDLEKAYLSLQSEFSRKAQAIQEVKIDSPDEFDNIIAERVEIVALSEIERALNTIRDPEAYKTAIANFARYKATGEVKYIDEARGFLDRSVDNALERNLTSKVIDVKNELASKREQIIYEPARLQLQELENEDPEFLSDKSNQEIIVSALKLNPKIDLRGLKSMIESVKKAAIEGYIAKSKSQVAKNTVNQPDLKSGNTTVKPTPKTKNESEMSILDLVKLDEEEANKQGGLL